MNLSQKRCVPCEVGGAPLSREEAEQLLTQVKEWTLSDDGTKISKECKFKNFLGAMEFANKITPIAEGEGHHPDIFISWGKMKIELTTHAIGGLSENDFILAAKIDAL